MGMMIMNQRQMMAQQAVFDDRLRNLENEKQIDPPPTRVRSAYAGRGRTAQVKRAHLRAGRAVPRRMVSQREADVEDDGDGELEDLGSEPKLLSEAAQDARRALQKRQVAKFRELCGVKDKNWPCPGEVRRNPETNELYLAPDFESDVTSEVNHCIIVTVAQQTYACLESWDDRPAALKSLDFAWDQLTIEKFAKGSFRTFKRQYEVNMNEEKARRERVHQRTTRWLQRRNEKCKRLLLAVPKFIEHHGIDPTPFIVQEHMSDEASGPEDDTEPESDDVWKRRMATLKGMGDVVDLSRLMFTEVIKPEWRSDVLSEIYHELFEIQWNMRNAKEKARYRTLRVTDSGRSTVTPPLAAPYDFGIKDWYTYGNPPGFEGFEVLVDHSGAQGFGNGNDADDGMDGDNEE
ncbi:hypothetical protein AB1N83_007668 [Pleurotus pulmonarius]